MQDADPLLSPANTVTRDGANLVVTHRRCSSAVRKLAAKITWRGRGTPATSCRITTARASLRSYLQVNQRALHGG